MNLVTIYGRLGQTPEVKELGNDNSVTNFSVATSRKYFSKKEDKQVEDVQWHSCSAFGKSGQTIAKYLDKGDPILITGRIEYRSYEKEGVKAKATNILVDRFEFVGGSRQEASSSTGGLPNHAPQLDTNEEIPF